MSLRLAGIWRHPVKALGREELDAVELEAGRTLPWDRAWAVAHEGARLSGEGWEPCVNFVRAASAPALMAVEARLDEATSTLTLTHPDLPELTLDPDAEGERLARWARALVPEGRAAPVRVVRAGRQGLTDASDPWVSLHTRASHRAVEEAVGRPLSIHRWRGNLWIDGAEPWEEAGWTGREIRMGGAVLRVVEPIIRCRATEADPATGLRDADTLGALRRLRGREAFGVYAEVVRGGRVAVGCEVSA